MLDLEMVSKQVLSASFIIRFYRHPDGLRKTAPLHMHTQGAFLPFSILGTLIVNAEAPGGICVTAVETQTQPARSQNRKNKTKHQKQFEQLKYKIIFSF